MKKSLVQKRRVMVIFAGFIATGAGVAAYAAEHHDHPVPEKLGAVTFPTSCNPASQKKFERAVALLHSFAYSATENAFRELITTDPQCAMAHWGLAMSYVHPLWEPHIYPDDAAKGQQAIQDAKRLGGSERERGFIDALDQLYANAESAPYPKRAVAYATAMEKLAQRYPNDVECQVFYALSLLSISSPADKTHVKDKKAADILEPLFKKLPQHPGVAHYLIHACDNSEMARRGVEAARLYAQIAPSAPHALHMPSHIHTRLGMWEDSIASNRAARKAARDEGDIGEELHAMDYLTYAYLQLGRNEEAAAVLKDLAGMPNLRSNEFKVGYAASAMPIRYAIERQNWNDAARLEPIAGTPAHVHALTIWARAVGSARGGNAAAARQELPGLEADQSKLQSIGEDYWALQVKVLMTEAAAWIAFAEGKGDEAIRLMRQAADEEDSVEKRPVTPGPVVPAREQLGDLLLQLKRPQEAVAEFETALRSAPLRRGAVQGKARALEAAASTKTG